MGAWQLCGMANDPMPANAMKITLHGGPWDGLWVDDRGQAEIAICTYEAKIPIKGQRCGEAVYEVEGGRAFWLENRWHGPLLEEIDADEEL